MNLPPSGFLCILPPLKNPKTPLSRSKDKQISRSSNKTCLQVFWKNFIKYYWIVGNAINAVFGRVEYKIFNLLCTMFSMFNVDSKILWSSAQTEHYFQTACEWIFVILVVDYLFTIMFEDDFIGGYLFWMDGLACLSMIPDTPFVFNWLFQNEAVDVSKASHLIQASSASQAAARYIIHYYLEPQDM